MNKHRAASGEGEDTVGIMKAMGRNARAATHILATAPSAAKKAALEIAAEALIARSADILEANDKDMAAGVERKLSSAFLDRLKLTPERLAGIAQSLRDIAKLDDPVGEVMAQWTRPNGLNISRVRTPLGVVGVIFESRPNVTADAGALCLMAGNAVILRGGSDSFHTSKTIHACLVEGLKSAGLPQEAIQIVPTTDRAAVGEMLKGLDGNIDVIVPRGGRSLVERVQQEARVPVFAHLEGLVHIYVDKTADRDMAVAIVLNSKLRRTGICGAAETLLVHRDVASSHLLPICQALLDKGCELRGDKEVQKAIAEARPATEKDWDTEYLDAIIAIRIVPDLDAAIAHIQAHSSGHTDAIVTNDQAAADTFFNQLDSAILLHNASTQFADGGEFGMGAEIGIATGRMHARGPVGVEQLTSFKYLVAGTGQTRP